MSKSSIARAMILTLALAALAPMLAACNTTAGAGQDVSATGHAITNGAQDVKRAM